MGKPFQIAIDAADPDSQCRFWAAALDYVVPAPPEGHVTWDDYYRSIGGPDDELGVGDDRLVDPDGAGTSIWFQKVPEPKVVKNRVHLDLHASGGRSVPIETRRERVDAEVERLLALGATTVLVHDEEGLDHYAVTLQDPEGNEFLRKLTAAQAAYGMARPRRDTNARRGPSGGQLPLRDSAAPCHHYPR